MKSKYANLQQLITEQQCPREISIKLQSNFTESTHQHGC